MFKIGVLVDSFRVGIDEGIGRARQIGAEGIQIYATYGDMAPENLTAARKKEILDKVESNGLVVSALCGDLGGHGFMDESENKWKIEKSKRIMELAKELKTDVVTTHIGVVPADMNDPVREIMRKACDELALFGDSIGASFAIETGPEKAWLLKEFLDSLSAKGVRVNFDPANLVMVSGDDAALAAEILAPYIVHTHAKDGVMISSDESGVSFMEMPLGEGDVDFPRYLRALKNTGYDGFLTIEREVGDDPGKDISEAVEFLRREIALL
ncbi:MAG: sugar phosphate isomerase/epimerase [Eubacteriales bacterium]|nr:sugar phosphate isomerase/epimerase [Eubacteriales bacterium]